MPVKQTGSARMDFRLPAETKQLIEQAAALSGQNLSDFATATLVRHAVDIVEKHRVIRLSQERYDEFTALLDAPARPIQAVTDALAERAQRKERRARTPGGQ